MFVKSINSRNILFIIFFRVTWKVWMSTLILVWHKKRSNFWFYFVTIFANFFYYLRAKWNILSIYLNIKHFLFHFLLGFGNIDLSLDPFTCAFFTFFSFSFLVVWSINFLSLYIVLQLPFSIPCPLTSFLFPLSFPFISRSLVL